MENDDDVLTEAEAAELLGVAPGVLATRRHRARKGNPDASPPWYRRRGDGRSVIRYKRSEVLAWQGRQNELVPATPGSAP